MITIQARFVVPINGPVIENGAVVIRGDRIADVCPVREAPTENRVDYGDAVILPGFVNAHTHLELTHLAGRVPPSTNFTDWLSRLMDAARDQPPNCENVQSAVRDGIAQSLRAGVTTVGDISRFPDWTRPVLASSPLSSVSFGEVVAIGTRRELLEERLSAALDQRYATDRLDIGVSPHAPYTVEPVGLKECALRARRENAPICIHVAETSEEEQFTLNGSGAFADYLKSLDTWDDSIPISGVRPIELLAGVGLLTRRTLLAHANYVSDRDIEAIAASGASVAFCPRTHHAFGHKPHRFREMLAAGINVCIGTDSLASNPSLSILDELRSLHRTHPDVPVETVLAMGTLNGNVALGRSGATGSLRAGSIADLAVIGLDGGAKTAWTEVLTGESTPLAVWVGGYRVDVLTGNESAGGDNQARTR